VPLCHGVGQISAQRHQHTRRRAWVIRELPGHAAGYEEDIVDAYLPPFAFGIDPPAIARGRVALALDT
jgi:hypothetical protein